MNIVIMAGGRGTRIASVNAEVPKPMILVLGKPILEYQIECLKKQGYRNITIVIGYLGEKIKCYFEDGQKFGVNISYIEEKEPLGTAGALFYLKGKITEDFLLINGDLIFDVDIKRFHKYHCEKGGLATILTHPNSHPFDSGIIISDQNGKIKNWIHKENHRGWYKNRVNAGIHILSPKILERISGPRKTDMDRDILELIIDEGLLFAYDSPEYVKDMGTPDRLYSVEQDLKSKKVSYKNLKNKQKAIFLDRDGTINKYVGFLRTVEEFELIEGVAEAVRKINSSGYLAIVVTNQPVIARGEVTFEGLDEIHNKMETLLGEEAAYLDAIYYCPHHPDRGFENEVKEYKIICECRKPKPGMLLMAASNYNIDLSQSWMIGDSDTDIKAGENAGCHTKLVNENRTLKNCVEEILSEKTGDKTATLD